MKENALIYLDSDLRFEIYDLNVVLTTMDFD